MKYGLLIFHQGWTDIMNCFGMVTHNAKQYDILYVFYREDAKPLAEFTVGGGKGLCISKKRVWENVSISAVAKLGVFVTFPQLGS
jgi:hypothetical protein